MAQRVVLFTEERKPMYLEGFRDSQSHCRGRFMPWGYNLVLVKTPGSPVWHLFKEDSYRATQERATNCLTSIDASKVECVYIPDTLMGDHLMIIKWATEQRGMKLK